MIILPSDGSMIMLWNRDVLSHMGDAEFSLHYASDQVLTLAATKWFLLYNALTFLGTGIDDDPVWRDDGLESCWMGEKGTKCTLYKPFYDTLDLVANYDRDPEYFEYFGKFGLSIDMSHPIPFHLLTGIKGEAPEEYGVIYNLVLRALQDYAERPYPWLLAVREFKNENRHVFYVSRTSALFCALKLLEMTFNEGDCRCEIDSVVRFYKVGEGMRNEWLRLSIDKIERKLSKI